MAYRVANEMLEISKHDIERLKEFSYRNLELLEE